MITAKDIFIMEQEMIQEAQYLMKTASLSPEQIEEIEYRLPSISEAEWNELHKTLVDRQLSPLERLKNGELLKVRELNIACKKAAGNE